MNTNDLGQPVGVALDGWTARHTPPLTTMEGRFCRLEPLVVEQHSADLYRAFGQDSDQRNWTYLPYGPFSNLNEFEHWLSDACTGKDPQFHTVVDTNSDKPVGIASYLRMDPRVGVIEVGHIHFSPLLQRTPASTEAMYLMMKRVFDELGYRRYEWKCDSLNEKSRSAAERLGFTFEGIFRQLTMYKGRNRDTAWYSILDSEWPLARRAFERWLSPANFTSKGEQIASLSSFYPSANSRQE